MKPKGVVLNVVIFIFGVTCLVYLQVMKDDLVAYPMLLGRPWLRRVHDPNYWNEGYVKIG